MADPSIQMPDGSKVAAPANVVLQCAPPDKAQWLRPGQFAVNDVNKMEAITQPLYSYQAYPAAGASTLVFFQNPASGTITREDTNMELAGQLPAPQKFLIQGMGIEFQDGTAPVIYGAGAASTQMNDYYAVMRRGYVSLIIGSKQYLNITTLSSLPVRSAIVGNGAASDTTTAGSNQQYRMTRPYTLGPVFKPNPMLLEASQNFRVEISWPGGAVAIPSSDAAARIGFWLYGVLYRSPQ